MKSWATEGYVNQLFFNYLTGIKVSSFSPFILKFFLVESETVKKNWDGGWMLRSCKGRNCSGGR